MKGYLAKGVCLLGEVAELDNFRYWVSVSWHSDTALEKVSISSVVLEYLNKMREISNHLNTSSLAQGPLGALGLHFHDASTTTAPISAYTSLSTSNSTSQVTQPQERRVSRMPFYDDRSLGQNPNEPISA
jgi:hypothetical protein